MPSKAEVLATYSSVPLSAVESAASLRAPMRGETLVLTVTTSAKVFNVPDGTSGQPLWKNRIVHMFADGSDVYIQVSTGTDANVDETAVAIETAGTGGRLTLTPSASGNGCWKIPSGQWLPIAFGADAMTFALKSAAACKLRTHVAET